MNELTKNKYTYIGLMILLAIFVPHVRLGLFALALLVLTVIIINSVCENKLMGVFLAFLALNYISSIFTIILFYTPLSQTLSFLESILTVFSLASITGIIDLFISAWISSQAIGFHITLVSFGSFILVILGILYFRNR